MPDWMQQVIDWFRNPPGQYIGYLIAGVIIFLLVTVRYEPPSVYHFKLFS